MRKLKVELDGGQWNMDELMMELSKQLQLSIRRVNSTISLMPVSDGTKLPAINEEFEVQLSVSGTVTDENGEGLPGATVQEKGTTNGTITDVEGNFSVNVSEEATLTVSFVGYETQEILVNGRSILDVSLEADISALEEVVVIGYGTREKGAVTGAISTVSNDYFEKRPMTNTLSALQGALPGVTILRGSGRPGSDNYALQIRGISSIGGNKPLVLVDGVPGDLNLLNPNDIQSVTVLKDAAASIYGSRAADGVVLVTTKKGEEGKPIVSYSGNVGIKTPEFLKSMSNTMQLVEMYDEGMKNINGVRVPESVFEKISANAEPDPVGWLWPTNPGFYQNTDWTKEIFGSGLQQMHNLNISGGGENNRFLFSAGYNSDEGIMNYGENVSDRYNLRMNYDFRPFEWIKVETKNSFDNRQITEPTSLMGAMSTTPRIWSFIPIYNTKNQFYRFRGWGNPVQQLMEAGDSRNNYSRFSSNIKAETTITSDLKIVTQMGITLGYGDANITRPTYSLFDWDGNFINYSNLPNSASYSNSKNYYGLYNAYLEYTKFMEDDHMLNVMVGASQEENRYQSQSVGASNFSSNELFTLNLADKTKAEYISLNGSDSQWTLRSYFARLSYEYQSKLFVDFTMRMDGSSKFAPKKRWSSVFPAASVAWSLSEEKFIKSLGIFNTLKLRGSWGQTGNQELSFGNYDYIPLVTLTGAYPFGSPNVGQTTAISSVASEYRTWETIESSNLGLDFAFLQSKLTLSFDYFVKENNKMLVNIELPAVLGGSAPTQNQGKLLTKGWDFT
ncbi:MAG: SusC/RagA family TonB-linked outer membrane protein, partial [Cytophagales bacterium]